MANKNNEATQSGPAKVYRPRPTTGGVETHMGAATKVGPATKVADQSHEYSERAEGAGTCAGAVAAPLTDILKDEARLGAEKFLESLPTKTRGVVITERGALPLSNDTELRDSVTLVVMYLFEVIGQAQALANLMAKFAAAKAEADEKTSGNS